MWRYATVAMVACSVSSAWAVTDDFSDNLIGPEWTLIEDSPTLSLVEQNQRLEVIANAPPSANIDAIYLSNGSSGFRLSTQNDFLISINYNYIGYQSVGQLTDILSLVLGVGRDVDGTDSAAIGVGLSGLGVLGYGAAYRVNDGQTEVPIGVAPPASGTMQVSYDALGDDLTLALDGVGSYTLMDTVAGIWNADALWVSFGARGQGHTLASGDAWLDSFEVVDGDVLPVPEPAMGMLLLAGAAFFRRKRAA